MTITLEIGPELQAKLISQAAEQGMALSAYAANLLEEATKLPPSVGISQPDVPNREVIEAIERLKVFGKSQGLSLRGLTIRELRHEARP
jgi:hypothetical protein